MITLCKCDCGSIFFISDENEELERSVYSMWYKTHIKHAAVIEDYDWNDEFYQVKETLDYDADKEGIIGRIVLRHVEQP